ncbi:hypothetical protein Ppa06_18020 [Planomonospora parontospora subsp. parontospora]|uniref:MFS transporter n=2 Tax=Planomonospora parontospora TaxID=58119 RepID=A0AA37F4D1_9ACTN|nr:hypothetical protein GCM10010126_25570 [Planomonospora parontospora]GII08004.1 hypothetical protein Ppa06_18020 [Planomonospora parontospora subsp. parontospora]
MAVPPPQPTRTVAAEPAVPTRAPHPSLLLDVVLGLLVAVALPLAIVAIPNTISVVAALLPPGVSQIELIRAHGLALPSMVMTVPLAALIVRRLRAAPVLMAGLTLLAVADAAGGFADSALTVGVLRGAHGIGAGLLIPATLVAVWERPRMLRAVWAGMLATSLMAAQALALWPLDAATSWRVTLQPYPLLTGIALTLAAVYLVLRLKGGQDAAALPGPGPAERKRLLLAAVPSVSIAFLAFGTTFDWSPGLVILTALLAVAVLAGFASAGSFEGTDGRILAYTMLTVGVVILSMAAQVTYVELRGLGGPGLAALWPAFVLAGAAAVAAAVLANRLNDAVMPMLAAGGLVLVVAGLCTVRFLLPAAAGPVLIAPFVLLAAGSAVALSSALRLSGVGASLFALSLFFPGVLVGFLLGSGIQVARLKEAVVRSRGGASSQALVDAFVSALHLWALVGGGLVVVVIVLCALLARRSAGVRPGTAAAEQAGVRVKERVPDAAGPGEAAQAADHAGEPERPAAGERPGAGPAADEQGSRSPEEPEVPEGSGTGPVVPSPMPSPEDSGEDGPADRGETGRGR